MTAPARKTGRVGLPAGPGGTLLIWQRLWLPEGQALDYWLRAKAAIVPEEEKVLAGDPNANLPELLTKDVPGG